MQQTSLADDTFVNNCIFTTVPLKEIDVKVQIQGFVAEVTSSLLYSNEEDNPVEASFTFPVDDGSAVYRFEAEIEGKHIVAEIQGKEQVRKVRKRGKIRNRYNQAPHLTQDTNGKVTTSQLDITNESQEVSPFPAGDHKASINRRARKHNEIT